jgi:hypothetical protein
MRLTKYVSHFFWGLEAQKQIIRLLLVMLLLLSASIHRFSPLYLKPQLLHTFFVRLFY